MKIKMKRLLCVLAVVLCMTAFSVTAFASDGGGYYASNENGDNTPPASIDSITVSTEGVKLPENQGSNRLTPDGNMTLIDDILQDESYYVSDEYVVANKQFITVQSKNGNTFYLVIDRSGDSENVYFLNLVDEADLMALMDDGKTEKPGCTCTDKCVVGAINTGCEICRSNMSECVGKEKAPEPVTEPDTEKEPADTKPEKKPNSSALLIVLVLALAGGGAVWYFKFRKPKTDTKGAADLDDYDYGQAEDEEEETEIDDADVMAESDEERENN